MAFVPVLITFVGVVLLGLAIGFLLAISIGIRRQDNRGSYRSLRDDDDSTALSRTGSLVVGLRFTNDTAASTSDRDRTPSAV